MEYTKLKDNIVKLRALLDYHSSLDSDRKSTFKKRYVRDKILSICIDNKKLLDKAMSKK